MAARLFTDEQARVLAREYERCNMDVLAERHGCSRNAIYRTLTRVGAMRPRGGKPVFSPSESAAIRAAFDAGTTIEALSREHGCGRAAIRRAVVRAGGTVRHQSGNECRKWSDEVIDEIVAARREGKTQDQLALQFGTSQGMISRLLIHAGERTQRRPRSEGATMADGYVLVGIERSDPMSVMAHSTGYVMEHRLVMARHLGRPLERHETVHHLNGDRADNRIENLQLRQGPHGNGTVARCRCCGSEDIELVELG